LDLGAAMGAELHVSKSMVEMAKDPTIPFPLDAIPLCMKFFSIEFNLY
jgi:hypothetical protein